MRWEKIFETLKNYKNEENKGWYSPSFSGNSVYVSRKSDPNTIYVLRSQENFHPGFVNVMKLRIENSNYFWEHTDEYIPLEDLSRENDYFINNITFFPYISMVKINAVKDNINDETNIYKSLTGIKHFISAQERLVDKKRHFNLLTEKDRNDLKCEECGFCGYNDHSSVNFYFNNDFFYIGTGKSILLKNRNRKHFSEREFLFPYVSNGWNSEDCLYIQSCNLSIEADKKALKAHKDKIIRNLNLIFKESGITDFELIEIRKPYKYQDI